MDIDTLKIPSSPDQIQVLERYIQKLSVEHKICDDLYPNILISLTEAVNNAILHGNNRDRKKFVDIAFNKTNNTLVFRVSDEGTGFNPNSIPDPTHPDHIECCGGRGVFLMKELSDTIHFHNKGRTVEICFKIP